MKLNFLILLFITTASVVRANPEKRVKNDIKDVTVYLNRAQITGHSSVAIEPGITDILIENLPSGIIPQSVQVSGKGDFIIMAVKTNPDFINTVAKSPEIQKLEDSLEMYQDLVDKLQAVKHGFSREEQMIMANQVIGGKDKTLDLDDLEEAAEFFRKRITDIHVLIAKNEKELKKNQEKMRAVQQQLKILTSNSQKTGSRILVTVSSKVKNTAVLELSYIIADAGWYPIYDIRAKDTKSPVQLQYKAQVYQNSGLNWDKVKLTLSTGNPVLSGTKPVLNTFWLDFYQEPVYKKEIQRMAAPAMAERGMAREEERVMLNETMADHTSVLQTTLAVEFDISMPYSIASDGVGQIVDIQSYELPATYKYVVVPKLDKDVFLTANVTGWDNLHLLNGNANIYFEGAYVGETFINTHKFDDTLELSMGRDKNVIVERKRIKDFSSKSFLGGNNKEEHAFEIVVRNTKKESLSIVVEDQIPVSKQKELEVDLIDALGAQLEKESGKLVWNLKVNPSESKKIILKYSVKYPKNKKISNSNW
jgi:uncharacterized protein (TIGR02231 family)